MARDPYAVLVSEAMLQQTQVARVLERFPRFMRRFPTVKRLAAAPLDDVLAEWSGMGYYRRARNLHATAVRIVQDFNTRVPESAAELRTLPGVGAYTAGAVASIAFGRPEPAIDGNVTRVLMRLEGIDLPPQSPEARHWVAELALSLVQAARSPGEWNEALMELGATVCTPALPRCGACPLRQSCVARGKGVQDRIPAPARAPKQREVYHAVVVVRDRNGRVLVERRPDTGLWAGMWQAPSLERDDAPAPADEIARELALAVGAKINAFTHQTTHRRVQIAVYEGRLPARRRPLRGEFMEPERIATLALSNPQRRILLAGNGTAHTARGTRITKSVPAPTFE